MGIPEKILMRLAWALLLLPSLAFAQASGRERGLILAYGFNHPGSSIAYDSSPNQLHGTITGGMYKTGIWGQAWDGLGSGSYMKVTTASIGTKLANGGFTLIYRKKFTSDNTNRHLLNHCTSETGGTNIGIWLDGHSGGHLNLLITYNGGAQEGFDSLIATPQDGKYHTLAVVYDGLSLLYYIDASLVFSQAVAAGNQNKAVAAGGGPLVLFGQLYDGAYYWPNIDEIDEVQIYGRGLPQGEIRLIHDELEMITPGVQ